MPCFLSIESYIQFVNHLPHWLYLSLSCDTEIQLMLLPILLLTSTNFNEFDEEEPLEDKRK